MYILTLERTRKQLTPWGAEVQRILRERQLSQDALCESLTAEGYAIDKVQLCRLLRGGTRGKLPVILAINAHLGIPCDNFNPGGGTAQDGSCVKGSK